MNSACKQCPYRSDSSFCYDADAMEELDDGDTAPACHMVVGHESIFAHAPMNPPDRAECMGYARWMNAEPGFEKPRAASSGDIKEKSNG